MKKNISKFAITQFIIIIVLVLALVLKILTSQKIPKPYTPQSIFLEEYIPFKIVHEYVSPYDPENPSKFPEYQVSYLYSYNYEIMPKYTEDPDIINGFIFRKEGDKFGHVSEYVYDSDTGIKTYSLPKGEYYLFRNTLDYYNTFYLDYIYVK